MTPLPPQLSAPFPWRHAWTALAVVTLLGLAALYTFDPSQHSFYPRCTLKLLTNLDCPGCGGLRATHQLLHGNLAAAFRLNPLAVTLAALATPWLLWAAAQHLRRRPIPPLPLTARRAWLLVAITIAFTILRNWPAATH